MTSSTNEGRHVDPLHKYDIGHEITYTCNIGFEMAGGDVITCIETKGAPRWSTSVPSCPGILNMLHLQHHQLSLIDEYNK